MFSYRDAQGADFEQIVHFPKNEDELFFMFPRASYPLTVLQLRECAESRIEPTVFLFKKQIVGYANIIKIEAPIYGSIGNIVVSPNYRGKGLGRYIIDTMSNKLQEKYLVDEIRLACFSTNIAGLILYQRCGFKPHEMEIRSGVKNNKLVLLHLKKKSK